MFLDSWRAFTCVPNFLEEEMEYTIENANREDYEELRNLINETGTDLLQSGLLLELDEASLDRLFNAQMTVVAVARDAKTREPLGTAMICFKQTWRALTGYIEYVVVRREYWGQGIGKGLVGHLHYESRTRNALVVKLISESHRVRAREMYQKMGYTLDTGIDDHFTINLE